MGWGRRKDTPRPVTPLDRMILRHERGSPLEKLTEMSELEDDLMASYLANVAAEDNPSECNLERLLGDRMLSVSYGRGSVTSPGAGDPLAGSFVRAFQSQSMNVSLNVPFMHQMMDSSVVFQTASRAPNKALLTISAESSRILVANKFASEIFDIERSDLIGMKIQSLFSEPYQAKQRALVEQHIDSTGQTVLMSGKVVSLDNESGSCSSVDELIFLYIHTYMIFKV